MKGWMGVAILLSLGAANLAVAADWSVVPSVTQKSEFNSNINLTYYSPISDYIFTLTPAADFNYTTEITQLQGHLGLSGQHYITNSNLDHIDQNYQINGKYQATPKVNLVVEHLLHCGYHPAGGIAGFRTGYEPLPAHLHHGKPGDDVQYHRTPVEHGKL